MAFYTYIIQSKSTGKIYTGQTCDLVKRLRQHNDPDCKIGVYTKKNKGPWKLFYYEKFNTRSDAIKREKQLKSGKGREFIKKVVLKK